MSSSGGPLFAFRAIPVVAGMLAARAIDARKLLREAGLPEHALAGEIIAPLGRVQSFLELAATATNSPLFGIDVAERVPAGAFGFTEFLMRSAPSVARGLEILCAFAVLINPVLDFRFDASGPIARVHLAIPSTRDVLGRHLNEYTFALMIRQFSAVLGERWPVEEAWFAHERTAQRDAVAARFGCPVAFGAADCGIGLRRASVERTPPTADPALFEFLLAQARAQIANLGPTDVIAQVSRTIEARLPHGSVTAEGIAAAMATTVRSLQRHLAEAGTSYREVLAHVRRRRRAELLRSGLDESAIALRLGFSDSKSMRRSLDD